MKSIPFFPATLLLSTLLTCLSSIIFLDSSTFHLALQQKSPIIIFFHDNNCKQCQQQLNKFYTLYSLAKYHKQMYNKQEYASKGEEEVKRLKQEDLFYFQENVMFCVLEAIKQNEEVFKNEGVDAVPELRVYEPGGSRYHIYGKIGTRYQELYMMAMWVRRVTQQYLPQFQSIQQVQNSKLVKYTPKLVITSCKSPLLQSLTQSPKYLSNLALSYICLTNSNLRKQQILLKHSTSASTPTSASTSTSPSTQKLQTCSIQSCQNLIQNFKYEGLVRWNDDLVHALFYQNVTVVLLVCSNQSQSWSYVRKLGEIKGKMEREDGEKETLPVFAVADLHYDLQAAIRAKKFIGGYDLKGWPYPYPILAYLSVNNESKLQKSIYQQKYNNTPTNPLPLQQWLLKAKTNQLPKDLRSQDYTVDIDLVQQKASKSIIKIYLSQLQQMIAKYATPIQYQNKQNQKHRPIILVFVLWRTSYEMQHISHRMKKWWVGADASYDAFFYLFDMQENQLPGHIRVDRLPAFIVYYDDGQYQVHQGIKDLEQIKNIVELAFGKNKNKQQNKQQGK